MLNLEIYDYGESLALMRRLVKKKRQDVGPEVLMMLEHNPVLTMGRRSESSDILVSREVLSEKGISVYQVERGGLVTYHGPGQLIGYPVFNLRNMGLGAGDMVHGLEEIVFNTLSEFGIAAERKEGKRGAWIKEEKIASIGIAIRGGISFHGVALNHDPDLSHFDLINPCGLSGVRMTSISKILGRPVDPDLLRKTMTSHFEREFQLDFTEWSLSQVEKFLS